MLQIFDPHDAAELSPNGDRSLPPDPPQASTPEPSTLNEQPSPDTASQNQCISPGIYSCLTLYLAEIGKVKLLSPQQELELALRVQNGDHRAREEMIKANLRLVVKIARDYEHLGLPLLDLISEGNIGLMKAVERFNPSRGAKLSTYASCWIKQSIKRALANQSKTVRLPVHMVGKISRLNRAARRLYDVFGREPTDEELAAELGTTASRVSGMRVASNRPLSLDAPVGDQESNTYAEVIEDQHAQSPLAGLESKTLTRVLRETMLSLSPREASILQARFGLNGARTQNLDEVGATLGITRERVRQLQNKALAKLRALLKKLESTPQCELESLS